jgi:hypothetical protein
MNDTEKVVSLKEAKKEVGVAITRLALMHLAYSKTLIEELGDRHGEEIIIRSILEYGRRIAEIVKQGGQDLPSYGVYSGEVYQDEEGKYNLTGCNLARIFKQFDELDLGRYYCYVDPAKSMASNLEKKLIHTSCEARGDSRCTLEYLTTTKEDRESFSSNDINRWKHTDPYLL